jgi:hypothetical protein
MLYGMVALEMTEDTGPMMFDCFPSYRQVATAVSALLSFLTFPLQPLGWIKSRLDLSFGLVK